MKIGYTIFEEEIVQLKEAGAESIILNADLVDGNQQFIEFLKVNKENDIVLVNTKSISSYLSMVQLFGIIEKVNELKVTLHFLDQGTSVPLSDKTYIEILWHLSSFEKEIVKNRVLRGMEVSKERGVTRGRPTLESDLVEKIRKLNKYEKKTIREIATICGVSIGSVHKYIQLADDQA